MNHILAIGQLVRSISSSSRHHAIIIEGPPGWGKTTAVDEALRSLGVEGFHLGSFSTPLNLYNFLFEHSDGLVVIDDCAGLFSDAASMAILKAATWPQGGKRMLRWGSTSSKAVTSEFEFQGKFVMICNSFPKTPDGEAIRSRSFLKPIQISEDQAKNLLLGAAHERRRYPKKKIALEVAEFLNGFLNQKTTSQISYRTLEMGYELALDHPHHWKELLAPQLPLTQTDPEELIRDLRTKNLKVKDQVRLFEEATGLKKRSFFNYRKRIAQH